MVIQQAQVSFSQQHVLRKSTQRVTTVIENGRLLSNPEHSTVHPRNQTSGQNRNFTVHPAHYTASLNESSHPAVVREDSLNHQNLFDLRLEILKAYIEQITGQKIQLVQYVKITRLPTLQLPLAPATDPWARAPERIEVELNLLREYESSEVEISAQLIDSKGEFINISMLVTMERQYEEIAMEILVREGHITDPLVINFNGETVRLGNQLTAFDLNSDGIDELIPTLESDSAYIALDRNGDGIINNGSELFGTQSGNGFAELASFDEDDNGFIDANDSIYSHLRAYNPATRIAVSLKDKGVEALYLDSVDSPFRLTDSNNRTLGLIRTTGFYIDSNNRAGSLTQLDLIV